MGNGIKEIYFNLLIQWIKPRKVLRSTEKQKNKE
jgi:hypothetical protein